MDPFLKRFEALYNGAHILWSSAFQARVYFVRSARYESDAD